MNPLIQKLLALCAVGLLGAAPALAQTATDVDCDECVDRGDIARFAITSDKIKRENVTGSKIAPFAVSTDKIRSGSVTGSKIAQFAVSSDKLRQDSVNGSKIAPNAVGITQINPTQVQQRVTGVCPPGSFMTEVSQIGSVTCVPGAGSLGGDGSAGDLVVAGVVNWSASPPLNPNFANITIQVAGTLIVPAGTTISCSGNFVNNGTIEVQGGATNNGTSFSTNSGATIGYASAAHPGDSPEAANGSDWHNDSIADTQALSSGNGGEAINRTTVTTSLKRFRIGGGSGGGALSGSDGGGLVIIKCNGAVINSGTINANGTSGPVSTGGGGGGIVVLASSTTVDNSGGTINARGGNGGPENGGCCAPGGGGGGGIVVSIAPSINNVGGIIDLSGGAAVNAVGTPTSSARTAGGGGGASGGSGGNGGSGGASNGNSTAGFAGYSLEMPINPSTVL